MTRHDDYAFGAAIGLVSVAALELAHVIVHRPWGTLPEPPSNALSIFVAAICSITAVAVLVRNRTWWLPTVAWMLSIFTPMMIVGHAVVLPLVGSKLGLLLLPMAFGIGICLKRTYDEGELRVIAAADKHHYAA